MFTKNAFNGKADPVADSIKSIAEADYALKLEALKGDQVKLDKNKNNKLDADDFKILRGKKKVNEADEKPRSAGSVFDKDVAKSFEKKKPGESTGHESKKTSTGTEYTKKAPKPEETNEDFNSFKSKLKAGAKKVLAKVGGGSDEDQLKRLQKNMGVPQTGKKPEVKEEFDLEEIDPALVEEFMQTEEFQQLDELSKGTLSSYVKKSKDDLGYHAARVAGGVKDMSRHGGKNTPIGKELHKDVEKSVSIRNKRSSGIDRAATKLAKEEVEEISELKKSTLASYAKKATDDVSYHSFTAGTQKASDPERLKSDKKAMSRQAGVNKAVDRLAKEEVEELSELSKTTLGNYYNAAKADNKAHADSRRSGDKDEAKYAKDRFIKRATGMGAAKQRLNKEEIEQIDELSKDTLKSYQDKAMKTPPSKNGNWISRISGIARSAEKLKKEDVEQVEERELTPAETAEKEKNVKGMKKNIAGFRARYGSRAKEVMYATATKQAKD